MNVFDSKNINIFDLSNSTVWDLCLGGTQLNEHENVHHSIIYNSENIGSFLCLTNTLWLIPLKNIIKLLKMKIMGLFWWSSG